MSVDTDLAPDRWWQPSRNAAIASLMDTASSKAMHPAPRLSNPPSAFLTGLKVQTRVIGSLLIRELHSRFGKEGIGYLWFIGEPMMLATVITLIHLVQSTAPHAHGEASPAAFAILGYTLFIIFRGMFNRADNAIAMSHSLFYHRMVTVFDLMVSRSIIEAAGCFSVMVILLGLAVSLGLADLPARPLYLLSAVGLMCWWSMSLGMIAAVATYGSETWGRQLHVISYFSIPISGAFFEMDWLPSSIANVLQWYPMPLIFEQARYGMFEAAATRYVDPSYVCAWCGFTTYLALILLRRVRSQIQV